MKLSRRAFLRLALLAGIAGGAGVIYKTTESVGFANWFRWMLRGQTTRLLAPPACVALAPCPSYDADIRAALASAWTLANAPDLRGMRVVLKPNLVDAIADHPSYTHPRVVEAMIQLAHEQGARDIVLAEAPTFRRDARAILKATGFDTLIEKYALPFVDLNYDDLVSVPLKGGYTGLSKIFLAKTIADAEVLISLPKLKTHHWTTVSASLKNLFGIVPGIKYGWPKNTLHVRGISEFLAELADSLPVPTRVAVVDGVVGMQGDGPLFGTAVPVGALFVGTDFLAVDATCARVMSFDPAQIDYLAFAAWAGVGHIAADKINLVGAPLAQFQKNFQRPPGR
jgi:uncharacterized protein (DUF362 family)